MRMTGLGLAGLALLVLAGCDTVRNYRDRDPMLMFAASNHRGPDEFAILPTRPLQAPPSLTALPDPTPGGRNLVDPDPRSDVAVALGGRPIPQDQSGIAAADSALYAHAARHGVPADIRDTLAAEDLEFRRQNNGRLLERIFGVNVYHRAYRRQGLDRYAELEHWRRNDRATPSAPPDQSR
jgi:hypothetical protein